MTGSGLRYCKYEWAGRTEWLAEAGNGPAILFLPPLFEEMNRCRAFLVAIMRAVADAGFRAVLPDLPGTGESPRNLHEVSWDDWTGVVEMLSADRSTGDQPPMIAGFRGGCLLEPYSQIAAVWRFAPVAGAALVRDLVRAKQASSPGKTRADAIESEARTIGGEFAGYALPADLFRRLGEAALPDGDARTVRLANDPGAAALKIDGRPLWRQAEPGTDPALSIALGDDIAAWARACAA